MMMTPVKVSAQKVTDHLRMAASVVPPGFKPHSFLSGWEISFLLCVAFIFSNFSSYILVYTVYNEDRILVNFSIVRTSLEFPVFS